MKSYTHNPIVGMILIVVGSFILLQSLAPFIMPVIGIGIGLYAIDYGLQMRGMPTLKVLYSIWKSRLHF